MNSTVIRISTEKVMLIARHTSSSHVGIGRISITRMLMMPNASATSPRFRAPTMLVAVFWAALAMMGPVIKSEGAISGVCRRLGRRHAHALVGILPQRSEERRVGKGGVKKGRTRGSPD